MKAGIAKVGQRVRLLKESEVYPRLPAGTLGTIIQILAQNRGAQQDAFLLHPDEWSNDKVIPCYSGDVEEAEAQTQEEGK